MLRDTVASVVFEGERKILLNLAGVPYMDIGGLGELVRCSMVAGKASGAVKLVNMTRSYLINARSRMIMQARCTNPAKFSACRS